MARASVDSGLLRWQILAIIKKPKLQHLLIEKYRRFG